MFMRTPFYAELPNHVHMVTDMGEGLVFRLSVMPPPPNGWGPSASQFWGSFLYMRTPFVIDTKFDVITRGGGRRVSCSHPRLPSQDSGSRAPQFFSYLRPHPLTQNDQIRHGNIMGRGVPFRR